MKAASLSCGTLLLLSTLSSPVDGATARYSLAPQVALSLLIDWKPSSAEFPTSSPPIKVGSMSSGRPPLPPEWLYEVSTTAVDAANFFEVALIDMGVILNSGEVTVTCGGACQQPNLAFSGTTEDAAIVQDNGVVPIPGIIEPELSLGETGEDIDVPDINSGSGSQDVPLFSPSALSAVSIDNDNLLGAPLAVRFADLPQPSNGATSESGDGGDRAPEPPRPPGDDNGGDSSGGDSNGGGMLDDSDDNGGSMGEPACTESTLTSRDNCP